MSYLHGIKWIDDSNVANGFLRADGKPRVSSMPYLHDIAEGNITGHQAWAKYGYTPTMNTVESDIWSGAGAINFPVAADGWDVLSANAADGGVSIFDGTSSGGTATSLIDGTKNFNGGTAVEVGDCIILDKAADGGRTPEWGYVTAVTNNTTLEVLGGFSSSGTGFGTAGRAYYVLDRNDATGGTTKTGAQAVKVEFLKADYSTGSEIVILLASSARNLVQTDTFRVNSFRIIATGTANKSVGALSLRLEGGARTVYSYITAAYTRARNIAYTVPLGKVLYIAAANFAYAFSENKVNWMRCSIKANRDPSTGMLTGSIFYPYSETIVANGALQQNLDLPVRLPAKTDLKVSGIASVAGIATCALRGWLETP